MAILNGEQAPDFTLPNQNNSLTSLSQFFGKIVILYFYPKDDTPGCTKEACSFRDIISEYQQLGAVVLGVSKDNINSHKKFIEKYGLNFDLLSDESGKVHESYEVIKPKKIFGKSVLGVIRSTFVIDQKGHIAQIFPGVKVDGHAEEVLTVVKNLISR